MGMLLIRPDEGMNPTDSVYPTVRNKGKENKILLDFKI